MDRMIIYGFDENYKKVKLFRIKAEQMELNLVKDFKNNDKYIITFSDLINYKKEYLIKKEQTSLNVIRKYIKKYNDYDKYSCISGGKDSDIIIYLINQIDNNIPKIFNNTTLDTPYTYRKVRKMDNVYILSPDIGFYQQVKKYNFIPTRFRRRCCDVLKEKVILNHFNKSDKILFFYGLRNSESNTRSEYGTEWQNESWLNSKGQSNWIGILPIRTWTDLDVWLYILWKKIDFNELYTFGYNRVGCTVACPFRTSYENILDKYFLTKAYERWQRILEEDFIKGKKWISVNCTIDEYKKGAWKGGLFRKEVNDETIKEFAEYENIDFNSAKLYFDQICICGKRLKYEDIKVNLQNKNKIFKCKKCIDKH